jgi:hypothetical protein
MPRRHPTEASAEAHKRHRERLQAARKALGEIRKTYTPKLGDACVVANHLGRLVGQAIGVSGAHGRDLVVELEAPRRRRTAHA